MSDFSIDLRNLVPASDETILTVALLGPDEQRRKAVANALSGQKDVHLQEFFSFPAKLEDLPQMLVPRYDVVLVDVDCDPDYAFDLVEKLCANGRTYIMAYSEKADMKVAIHFMRAGVREFFTLPLDLTEIDAALKRALEYHAVPRPEKTAVGKLFVFFGAKGGCGVTTLAANFGVALAQESGRKTLLIDLGLPLGDVAINLGMTAEHSVAAALQHPERLDVNLLSTLVVAHSSGLSLLAAPAEFLEHPPSQEAIDKLLTVTRQQFDYVVVDAGSRLDLMSSALFHESASVFLIAQVGISELRNANRLISKFFARRDQNLQIVLNRYKASDLPFDDTQITKALTRPAQWKIPDDYAAARRTRNTATPMVLVDSAIARAIREMAKTAGGLLPEKNGKKGLFSFLR